MRVLMIAPQPFFEPRGTPISILQRLHGLSDLGCQVDLVTYHLGEDVRIPGVNIVRAPRVPFVHKVKVGPSLAKIPLDIMLFLQMLWMLMTRRYEVIHSHEEAAFWSMPLSRLFRTPHLYDMHSILPKQLANYNFGNYRPIVRLFETLERWVLKTCDVVLTIGLDLEEYVLAVNNRANHIRIENTAVQSNVAWASEKTNTLKEKWGLVGKLTVVYTGTFEAYQGLDLLFESACQVVQKHPETVFVMVGGKPEQVAYWQKETMRMGLTNNVVFTGIVPLAESLYYLEMGDILVSPRIQGLSIPLKLYSYLHSGKPMVATKIYAHTQILDEETAIITEPNANAFSDGLLRLIESPALRLRIGEQARAYAEREFSQESYLRKLAKAYLAIKLSKRITEITHLEQSIGQRV